MVIDREKWRGIVRQAKSHSGLYSQRKKKKLSRYNDSLRTGQYGDRIPMEARLPAPVQTGIVTLPASYTVGTGSLLGIKWTGYGVNHPTSLALRLKKEYSYIPTPALCIQGR